jgi:hypothetical protein
MLLNARALSRTGYTFYQNTKASILLRTHTAGTLLDPSKTAVWRLTSGEACYAIAVSLLCPEQSTICIASTYIPTDTDGTTKPTRSAITDHHLKVYAHAHSHTFAILSMDANETNHV